MIVIVDGRPAVLGKGYPRRDRPKTYTVEKVASHNFGDLYNPSILTILRTKGDKANPAGRLMYEYFRDGSFYYGRLTFLDE